MDDPVDLVDRVGVRGWVCRLDAAALVDGDVDDDGSRLHVGEHRAGDELGGARTRDEDGTDDDVGVRNRLLHFQARRHEQADAAGEDLIEVAHPVDRALEERYASAEAERDDRRVVADDPSAEHDDVPRQDARRSRQENPTAAERLLEEVRRGLRREPSRDLAHRRQQRQPVVVRLDGLVGDGRDTAFGEGPREGLVGSDVEVREEDESFA